MFTLIAYPQKVLTSSPERASHRVNCLKHRGILEEEQKNWLLPYGLARQILLFCVALGQMESCPGNMLHSDVDAEPTIKQTLTYEAKGLTLERGLWPAYDYVRRACHRDCGHEL